MSQDPLDKTDKNESGTASTFTQAKQRLASHPDAKPETLDKLSDKADSEVVARVAENAQATQSTLEKLAGHEAPEVRSAVTENPNTPTEILSTLAQDEHPDVRFELAGNANTPVEILEALKEDENPYVVDRAQKTLASVKCVLETADELLLRADFAQAEVMYKNLISGLEALIGPEHSVVAQARHKLAAALAGQNKTIEAAEAESRAEMTKDALKAAKAMAS